MRPYRLSPISFIRSIGKTFFFLDQLWEFSTIMSQLLQSQAHQSVSHLQVHYILQIVFGFLKGILMKRIMHTIPLWRMWESKSQHQNHSLQIFFNISLNFAKVFKNPSSSFPLTFFFQTDRDSLVVPSVFRSQLKLPSKCIPLHI